MRGYWLDGTTERKLIKHRKFETSITRPGITLFFKATRTNNYHKNSDKRISARKRNRIQCLQNDLEMFLMNPIAKLIYQLAFLLTLLKKQTTSSPLQIIPTLK